MGTAWAVGWGTVREARQAVETRYLARKVAGGGLLTVASAAVATITVLDAIERGWLGSFGAALGLLPFIAVSALVVLRRPENIIGLLLAGVTFLFATGGLAERLVVSAQSRSLVTWSAWYGEWWWVPMLVLLLVAIPLLFPDGRLLTRRWRPVLWVMLATGTIAMVGAWFQTELGIGIGEDVPTIANPIGWAPWPEMEQAFPAALFFPTLFPAALLGLVSLVLRFRRSDGPARQQLKWGAFGLGVMGAGFLLHLPLELIFGVRLPGEDLFGVAVAVTMGVAILRYRLYDIDRIISRTAVYALLTVLLVGTYTGSVMILQGILRPWTEGSDLAVAASTLAVVALFQPARRRLQVVVDRRFHRSRYDARRMVEDFAARLRDDVDLASLERDLREVVAETVAPSGAWLWAPQVHADVDATAQPATVP